MTVRVERSENPIANAPSTGQQYDFRVDPLVSEQQVIKSQTVAERTAQAAGLQLNVERPEHVLLSTILGDRMPILRREVLPGDLTLHFDATRYSLQVGSRRYRAGALRRHAGHRLDGAVGPQPPAIRVSDVVLSIAPLGGVARELRANISTRVLPQTDIIEVTVTGPDPIRVAAGGEHGGGDLRGIRA